MPAAKNGDTVKVHYTGTLSDGEIFDTSKDRDPLQFTIGEGQVIPGFEEGIVGLGQGESKSITVSSDQGYGERNDSLVMTVALKDLNLDFNPKKGDMLTLQRSDGQQLPVRVRDLNEADITLDANHPLAGKDLTFEVTLEEIV
jgi:peptidylprolyl isomerase